MKRGVKWLVSGRLGTERYRLTAVKDPGYELDHYGVPKLGTQEKELRTGSVVFIHNKSEAVCSMRITIGPIQQLLFLRVSEEENPIAARLLL